MTDCTLIKGGAALCYCSTLRFGPAASEPPNEIAMNRALSLRPFSRPKKTGRDELCWVRTNHTGSWCAVSRDRPEQETLRGAVQVFCFVKI